jgi:hypothetical protein
MRYRPLWGGRRGGKKFLGLPAGADEREKFIMGTITASGTVNKNQAQSYEINNRSVAEKNAGRGCAGSLPQLFCHPAARPTGGYTRIMGQV